MKNKINYAFIIVLLIQCIFCNPLFSQQGWFEVTPISTLNLHGIYFNDNNNGIINGYKTTNAGLNWMYKGVFGLSLMFLNQNTGYLVQPSINYIYKTTNFGDNWIGQYTPYQELYCVYFPSSNTGYAFGYGSTFVKTTNGGSNWNPMTLPITNNFTTKNAFFTDNNTGYISAFGGFYADSAIIMKTINSGVNWNRILSFQNIVVSLSLPIFFVNGHTGFIGGLQNIYKTTNGGLNWISKNSNVNYKINSIYFSSNLIGYGVCDHGLIVKTFDAGENWYQLYPIAQNDLNTVFFINDLTGYACGSSGIVLKTTNGGGPPIGINPIGTEVPNTYNLTRTIPIHLIP